MSKKEKIAKIIRVITIPPILVIIMLVALYFQKSNIFSITGNLVIAIAGLRICPILAYPISAFIPSLKEKGREEQRKLSFICSIIGYTCTFLYGEIAHVSIELRFIFRLYFISVVILSILNKGFHVKASGHACSVTGPLCILSYFIGWKVWAICLIVAVISFWASLTLKRHKGTDLVAGCIACFCAFLIAYVTTLI